MPVVWPRVVALSMACAVALSGCGPRMDKVQPDIARQTLVQVLDHWKAGNTPDSLRKADPEVVVQDLDWIGGAKLASYEFVNDGESRDANLIIKVKLTLQDAQQKVSSKVVTYVISTTPKRTVFRTPFE